jgi:hypothetical protein
MNRTTPGLVHTSLREAWIMTRRRDAETEQAINPVLTHREGTLEPVGSDRHRRRPARHRSASTAIVPEHHYLRVQHSRARRSAPHPLHRDADACERTAAGPARELQRTAEL